MASVTPLSPWARHQMASSATCLGSRYTALPRLRLVGGRSHAVIGAFAYWDAAVLPVVFAPVAPPANELLPRIVSAEGRSPTGLPWIRICWSQVRNALGRCLIDLHTPKYKAKAGATKTSKMTNPAHEMRRSTPRLEPVTLTTSRTKIPYHATGCLSCADRAVIPQRGQ